MLRDGIHAEAGEIRGQQGAVVLFNDGHYEVKLKYRDEMEELLLNAALWQKEAQRYA